MKNLTANEISIINNQLANMVSIAYPNAIRVLDKAFETDKPVICSCKCVCGKK